MSKAFVWIKKSPGGSIPPGNSFKTTVKYYPGSGQLTVYDNRNYYIETQAGVPIITLTTDALGVAQTTLPDGDYRLKVFWSDITNASSCPTAGPGWTKLDTGNDATSYWYKDTTITASYDVTDVVHQWDCF